MTTTTTARPVVRVPGPHTRYTLAGDAVAESRVIQDLGRLSTGVYSELGDRVRALVLVGPFARAEGGVVASKDDESLAYPGYDLLAIFPRHPQRHAQVLHAIAAAWSRLLHTHVRLRAIGQRDLERVPRTRFWYHAGRGQLITIGGDPSLTADLPRYQAIDLVRDAWAFATTEALVALALGTLRHQPDEDLAAHLHRAVMSCGDAALLARRAYAPNLEQRVLRLRDIRAPAALIAAYEDAIVHMGRPDLWRPASGSLRGWLPATRRGLSEWHLGFERQRAGTSLRMLDYVRHPRPLFADPEERSRTPLRSALRALPLASPRLSVRLADPRERLLRAAVALAYRPHDQTARRHAAALLHVPQAPEPEDGALARALQRLAARAVPEDLGRPFADWTTGLDL